MAERIPGKFHFSVDTQKYQVLKICGKWIKSQKLQSPVKSWDSQPQKSRVHWQLSGPTYPDGGFLGGPAEIGHPSGKASGQIPTPQRQQC